MTVYFRNPDMIANTQRRLMRRMMENAVNTERYLRFPMEMRSTQDEFVLTALLPGLSDGQISMQFNDGILSIEGEYPELSDENTEVHFSELPVGKFKRAVQINDPVLSEKIEASMKDGVLRVRLPKAEEAKPKTIKINVK